MSNRSDRRIRDSICRRGRELTVASIYPMSQPSTRRVGSLRKSGGKASRQAFRDPSCRTTTLSPHIIQTVFVVHCHHAGWDCELRNYSVTTKHRLPTYLLAVTPSQPPLPSIQYSFCIPLSKVGQHGNRGKNGALETSRVIAAKDVGRSGMPRAMINKCNGLAGSNPEGAGRQVWPRRQMKLGGNGERRARKAVAGVGGLCLVLRSDNWPLLLSCPHTEG